MPNLVHLRRRLKRQFPNYPFDQETPLKIATYNMQHYKLEFPDQGTLNRAPTGGAPAFIRTFERASSD